MARIGNTLIALCSAAISIIYTTGYFVTEPTSAETAFNEFSKAQPTVNEPIQRQATAAPGGIKSTQSEITPTPDEITPTSESTSEPTSIESTPEPTSESTPVPVEPIQKYTDGTYTGSGTNRFGTVEVEVTIDHGKIAAVDITSSRTRYPQRYIDSLPAQVIDRQDENVDVVSGASRSSEDFIMAVHEALKQAGNS